jgi:hypothetical protein
LNGRIGDRAAASRIAGEVLRHRDQLDDLHIAIGADCARVSCRRRR